MSGIRAVLFDLDGTLLDTAPDFQRIINEIGNLHGRPPVTLPLVRQHASEGARAMLRLAFSDATDVQMNQLQTEFLDRYAAEPVRNSILFPGIDDTLNWLEQQQIHWGIVTNKSKRFAEPILHALTLTERCACLICPEHVSQPKPHPEALLLACERLQQPPVNTLYLGDHQRDIEAGRRAGMPTLACTYGYLHPNDRPATWCADHQVSDARELRPLLQCLYSESR